MNNFYSVRFYVTHNCNSNCVYCDTHDVKYRAHRSLDAENAKKLISQVRRLGCGYIDFTGGEPTLNPSMPELIDHANRLGITTEVTTNGVAGTNEITRKIASLAKEFNISLDTLLPEKYKEIRGVDALGNVMSVIEEIAEKRRIKLLTTVSDANFKELPNLINFAQEKGCSIYLNPVYSYIGGMRQPEASKYLERLDCLQQYFFTPSTLILLHFLEFYRDSIVKRTVPCSANRQTLSIAADGSLLLPCYYSVDRVNLPSNGKIIETLKSEEFRQAAKCAGNYDSCKNCVVTPYFGISFSYRLDKYSLLQTLSTKMENLKRLTDRHNDILDENTDLDEHLTELLRIVRSLPPQTQEEGVLYNVRKRSDGLFDTDIYNTPRTFEQRRRDEEARDIWELYDIPHTYFDIIERGLFSNAERCIRENQYRSQSINVLKKAKEFMVRWWKLYISANMKVNIRCDIEAEKQWIQAFFNNEVDCFCKNIGITTQSIPSPLDFLIIPFE